MLYFSAIFRIIGGLCLFLYGMKVMSDGIQQAAGDRLQRALNFMTGNRFIAVVTGFAVTAIVQSSSAVSVMLVSFVNAGLLTLTQSIGVIMGANIGTTTTAWIVSLIGLQIDISALALPAVGIGFVMRVVKWKHRDWGEAFLGFGFIFLGLQFLTEALPRDVVTPESMEFIGNISRLGFASVLIGVGIGTGITVLMHSSAATITLVITLAYRGLINFEIAAAMILGANIGTTIDAVMAAIGARTAAKRTALVHILFNVIGSVIAIIFFKPLLALVDFLIPGDQMGVGIATHLAMFHTIFNVLGTLVFLPFVDQFAVLVSFLIKDRDSEEGPRVYKLAYTSGAFQHAPELNIIRAEKEIRDMAGIASGMYAQVSAGLGSLRNAEDTAGAADALVEAMQAQEDFADQMREELTRFLIECTRQQLSHQSDRHVSQLLRIIANLEDITDDCYSISRILERSAKKNLIFKEQELEALGPIISLGEDFLSFVRESLGKTLTPEQTAYAEDLENKINKFRDKLRKLGRKRIEAGEDVKTELLFIDLVRRIENLGDYCFNISEALSHLR
jgi:phosphate:Na+ symporter